MAFWQAFQPGGQGQPPWRDSFPAAMPDGSELVLPLRDLGDTAIAGLIANQASFSVLRRLADWLTALARPFAAEVVVGLPTLGHSFAPLVAEGLGHSNWVAPGYSQKRWYDLELSVPMASITAPGSRRLWLDPRLLPRLAGRRVLLVDDVISTGASAQAGRALLRRAGCTPVALLVAMAQGDRWRAAWPATVPLRAVFATPLFEPAVAGWQPRPGTAATEVCQPPPTVVDGTGAHRGGFLPQLR